MKNKISKNIMAKLICVITFAIIPFFLISQEYDGLRVKIRMDDKSRIDEKAEPFLEQILGVSQNILGKYNDRATLIDFNEEQVTTESIERMREIFHSNARVFDDLVQYGSILALEDYMGKIRKFMNKTGPEYKITDLLLVDVVSNPAIPGLYFETKIRVNKLILNQIDEKSGKLVTIPKGGDLLPLEFVIIIQGDELEDVKIYEIQGKIKSKPKPYNKEVYGFSSMGFNTNTSFKVHQAFDARFSPKIEGKYLLDFGLKFGRSFKRGKHAKWIIGAAYGLHSWNANTQNSEAVFTVSGEKIGDLEFNRVYDMKNVDNQLNFSIIQAILGVQIPLRPVVGYKTEYWLEVSFMPTYVSKSEKLGENKLVNENSVVSFKNVKDEYCIEDFQLEPQGLKNISNSKTVGIQIKPYLRYFLNDAKTSGLNIGLGYVYYAGSWIDPNTTSSLSTSDGSNPTSLLFRSFSPAHLRLELGLSFKL